ncbi:hypothetical protein Rhe02_24180 [Rhizocola hellebori]|uniref:Uncharacterized protein n=1 Tax=Rhizocola hellebori TaxID=1392758 RepID=A0A8J3Q5V2_9ACTN|nr:hypothetical protein Rhe02_24180 [Rhizocola hellebori]
MPPNQEYFIVVVEDDRPRASLHVDEPVVEAAPIVKFYVGASKIDPTVTVQLTLRVNMPLHSAEYAS